MQEVKCPACDGGIIEAASKIYFNVGGKIMTLPDDPGPRVIIEEIEYDSSTNDELNGMPFNMEDELFVGCAHCGERFAWAFGDDLAKTVDMQSERHHRLDVHQDKIARTLDAMSPGEKELWTLRTAIMLLKDEEEIEFPSGVFVKFMAPTPLSGPRWIVTEGVNTYTYTFIDAIIHNHELIGDDDA